LRLWTKLLKESESVDEIYLILSCSAIHISFKMVLIFKSVVKPLRVPFW